MRVNAMKILVIGDVTSPKGVAHLSENLWKFREENKIDFCVVNGENASFITGISPELAEVLLRAYDVISAKNAAKTPSCAPAPMRSDFGFAIRGVKSVIAPTPRKMSDGKIAHSSNK